MIELTPDPIDTSRLLESVRSPAAGAIVLFVGTTREMTDGRQTAWLEYEAYAEMARQQLERLAAEARHRWPIVGLAVAHRLGRVPLAETSVAVVVSTPHRSAAFAAGEWLIDQLKQQVPIWKREHYADGATEWVHPAETAIQLPEAGCDEQPSR